MSLFTHLCICGCSIRRGGVWARDKRAPPLSRAPSTWGVSAGWIPVVRERVATRAAARYGGDVPLDASVCCFVTRPRERACRSPSGKHPSLLPPLRPSSRGEPAGIRRRHSALSPGPTAPRRPGETDRRQRSRHSDSGGRRGTRCWTCLASWSWLRASWCYYRVRLGSSPTTSVYTTAGYLLIRRPVFQFQIHSGDSQHNASMVRH